MKPNYNDGSFAILGKINKLNGIDRFSVVSLDLKQKNSEKKLFKRIIGMPNETIEYNNNQLYINGVLTHEPMELKGKTHDFIYSLGEDEYYCLGDNRENSSDSRLYGPFNLSEILTEDVWFTIGGK